MQQILQLGVSPERIIFASPRKTEDHITYAHEQGIDKIVIDSEDELRKLAKIVPTATVFLRLRADDPTSRVRLSEKFGLDVPEARVMLQVAVDLSVKVTVYEYNETLPSDIGGGFTETNFRLVAPARLPSICIWAEKRAFGELLLN
ncbi:hypothetical protein CNMCM5793_007953 [Aspergillus hiratsukae]|uniref:Orn/DAP/Arg decarboxylase 2 N-terminal domain-containing protein n=1 Tax=Aspergillus hiratsukae TaxID=1194566 RepID=A0A8H6PHH5_9EURO|nr:hypothetical protein CNMCM5793_007953 [Aspergillus hiratsukae]